MINQESIIALRMQRQCLTAPAGKSRYEEFFRLSSPVPPVYWCCPGNPPRIYHRADFDDALFNQERRNRHEIIKGRFQNGTIAYIEKEDLELFIAIYRKPIKYLSSVQSLIIETFKREGPMTIRILKEMTGLLVKEITPALHKLQTAFIVYEDQTDNEWDRGWYLFCDEFPEVDFYRYSKTEALKTVLWRFTYLNVWFDLKMAQSFYKIPEKDIAAVICDMVSGEALVDYEGGYIAKCDYQHLSNNRYSVKPSIFVLHRNDYMVKCFEHQLKDKYKYISFDVLQYILIDGEFKGTVIGKFKNGPFLLEDVIVEGEENEVARRQADIIEAVYCVNDSVYSPLKKYNGIML
ncbi:MAG: hypothetical protein PHT03_05115 [Bacilli bacterium]|nr:hypothetical protein [Bacilli bacterium]MDD4388569.1 hypothetical protein [Bacilli bacterium]